MPFAYGGNSAPSIPFPSTGSDDPPAAFGVMDSSEAAFYGLNNASVQNADGTFVAPTRASLEAAEQNLALLSGRRPRLPDRHLLGRLHQQRQRRAPTPCPTSPTPWCPPPPSPRPRLQAEANLLTNLVTFSHNGGGGL